MDSSHCPRASKQILHPHHPPASTDGRKPGLGFICQRTLGVLWVLLQLSRGFTKLVLCGSTKRRIRATHESVKAKKMKSRLKGAQCRPDCLQLPLWFCNANRNFTESCTINYISTPPDFTLDLITSWSKSQEASVSPHCLSLPTR